MLFLEELHVEKPQKKGSEKQTDHDNQKTRFVLEFFFN
jgi:hypothetical protein